VGLLIPHASGNVGALVKHRAYHMVGTCFAKTDPIGSGLEPAPSRPGDRGIGSWRGVKRPRFGQNAFRGSGHRASKVPDRVVPASLNVIRRQDRDLRASPRRKTDHVRRLPRFAFTRSRAASRSASASFSATTRPSDRSRSLSSIMARRACSDGIEGGSGSGKMSRGSSMAWILCRRRGRLQEQTSDHAVLPPHGGLWRQAGTFVSCRRWHR
jgi:hypothetical protein